MSFLAAKAKMESIILIIIYEATQLILQERPGLSCESHRGKTEGQNGCVFKGDFKKWIPDED